MLVTALAGRGKSVGAGVLTLPALIELTDSQEIKRLELSSPGPGFVDNLAGEIIYQNMPGLFVISYGSGKLLVEYRSTTNDLYLIELNQYPTFVEIQIIRQ